MERRGDEAIPRPARVSSQLLNSAPELTSRDQSAFILHLAQHWLPLRRFAPSPPHVSAVKRWYNLNSFLGAPEWISPTYLKMVLTQAEQEGYSVFVVRRAGTASTGDKGKETDMIEGEGWGDGGVGVLPECLADTMAVELGEPVGRSGGFGSGSATTMDQPSVDQSSLAGPSSSAQPKSRRKRQQDLDGAIPSDDPFLQQPGSSSAAQPSRFDDDTLEEDEMGDEPGASDFANHTRAYDDEDAAFQAALRASMEDVPEGWVAPDFGKKKTAGEGVVKRELPTPPVSVVQRAPPAEVAPAQNWRPAGGATEPRAPLREIPTEAAVEEDGTPLSPTEELTQGELSELIVPPQGRRADIV